LGRSVVWMHAMIARISLVAPQMEGVLDQPIESDRALYTTLVERELVRSYRLASLILGSGGEAEDAVGDALERAWRDFGRLRDRDRFQAWFDRILVNGCRDRLRRRGRLRFVAIDEGQPVGADPFTRILDGEAALRAVQTLEADERVVVILHYWADLTLDSIAERLGWPAGTVRSRLHRALMRMRAHSAADKASGQ
jgi:RNA polymerase sigma-70 factor, ECF subfamily